MRMMHRMREMGDGIVTLEIWKRCNAVWIRIVSFRRIEIMIEFL